MYLNIEHYKSSPSIVKALMNLPENIVYSSSFLSASGVTN